MKNKTIIKTLLIYCSLLFVYGCESTPATDEDLDNYARNDLFGEKGQTSGITNKTMEEAFQKAMESEQRGDIDKALYYYIQCLEFDPNNAKVLYRIARIHDKQGTHSIAARAYKEALQNDSSLILAHQALGIIEMENRQYQKAQGHLQKAILLDQKRLTTLGTVKINNYHSLDKESPINSYNVSGIIEDMHRNFDLARIYYKLALTYNENSANILSNLGYSYYLTGDLTLAEREYRRAINLDPSFKRAWSNLGLIYARKGQYNRAVKTFKQVMSEYDAYNDLGYFVMLEGRLDEAEYFFEKAIDMSPSYFKKAYANLEQVQMKKHELWLQKQDAQGHEEPEVLSETKVENNEAMTGLNKKSSTIEQDKAAQEKFAQKNAVQDELALVKSAQEKLAQDKLAQEKITREKLAQVKAAEDKLAEDKLAQQQAAQEKLAQVKAAEDKLAEDKLTQQQATQEKLAQVKAAEDKLAQDKLTQEQAAQEKLAQVKAAEDKLAKDKLLQEQATQHKLAQVKAAQVKLLQDKIAQKKLLQEQVVQEQATQEKLVQIKAAEEKLAQEKQAQKQAAQDQLAQVKAAEDKLIQDKLAQEKSAQEKLAQVKAAQVKLLQDKIAQKKLVQEQLVQEKIAQDKLEQDKLAQEKSIQEQLAQVKSAKEKLAQEKLAQEKLSQEKLVQEQRAEEKSTHEKLVQDKLAQKELAQEVAAQERLAQEKAKHQFELFKAEPTVKLDELEITSSEDVQMVQLQASSPETLTNEPNDQLDPSNK